MKNNLIIGSHCGLGGADMFLGSVKEALSYNANALMVYTGAPQNTLRKDISLLKISQGQELLAKNNIPLSNVIIHAPYIINPATNDISKREFCIDFLTSEIRRTSSIGSSVIVLHPGNYLTNTIEEAIDNIASVLNEVIENTSNLDVIIALETMAGKGTEVGRTFNEIREIINKINNKNRIGVCLDTCHIHDGGYDIVNHYEDVISEFDKIIGLSYLKVIHLNDSKNSLGSHNDRHANIDNGYIGLDTLKKVAFDPRFSHVPKILETPYIDGNPPYKEEIELIRR